MPATLTTHNCMLRIRRVTHRLVAAPLALSLASCWSTGMLWSEAPPRWIPSSVVGASVSDDRRSIHIGIEYVDGMRSCYSFPISLESEAEFSSLLFLEPVDSKYLASLLPLPVILPPREDAGATRHQMFLGATAVGMEVDGGHVEFLPFNGGAWVDSSSIPDAYDINWRHPGTYACIVLTPLAITVDVIMLPVTIPMGLWRLFSGGC